MDMTFMSCREKSSNVHQIYHQKLALGPLLGLGQAFFLGWSLPLRVGGCSAGGSRGEARAQWESQNMVGWGTTPPPPTPSCSPGAPIFRSKCSGVPSVPRNCLAQYHWGWVRWGATPTGPSCVALGRHFQPPGDAPHRVNCLRHRVWNRVQAMAHPIHCARRVIPTCALFSTFHPYRSL